MDGKIQLSLDKLPLKRLDIIEENGVERFPQELDYEEKTLSLVRRIDFAWALERDEERKSKKQKTGPESSSGSWPWQSMAENLQLAHQELSVIIDLINTVEANDAVTVAGMTRPKPTPNEVLSDLSVSAATKLQCFGHLGKYFKQSAKALEQQIAREARFYGALIRLQQNWKVKRQRVAASGPNNEGFTFDLFDNTLYDSASVIRRSSLSTVRIDHDLAGMLTINLPPNLNHALQFGFHGMQSENNANKASKMSLRIPERAEIDTANDDECIKSSHSLLREVHQAIFNEQVFDLVNREAFNSSVGYNVTGRRENFLRLSLGEGLSVYIALVPSREDDKTEEFEETQNMEGSLVSTVSLTAQTMDEKHDIVNKFGFPNRISYEIYLLQIFHEHIFMRERDKSISAGSRVSRLPTKEGPGLLGHFSLSLAHRVFASKVLLEMENVVYGVPYLHLISHPTWQSRTSSWTIFLQFPQSTLHVGSHDQTSDSHCIKSIKSQFRLKVVVVDDCINVEGEDTPNVVGHFKGSSDNISATNRYECDRADLPVIILQQIASQTIRWLHEEALTVGVKAIRDFLSLSFELDQGETLSLVVHVDPEDPQGCISWWLVMEDGFKDERNIYLNGSDSALQYRKFLGYLSLDALYSTLMELISFCNGGGSHLSA